MTTLFEIAIEAARLLPPERQDEIARLMLQMAGEDQGVYHLSDDERSEINAGIEEAEQNDVIDERSARKVLAQFIR